MLFDLADKSGSETWIRTKTFPLNRRADYCYPISE
jgi:hypothetical protein